ncbi:MAG: TIGR03546 family protein [Spirochaetales bacterium]
MPLKWIVKTIRIINANRRPGEVAAGIALGFVMALQPGFTFFRFLLLAITFLLKVHFPSALLGLWLASFVAPLLDPVLDIAGGIVLTAPFLLPLWTSLYAFPLVPLTRFNNTIYMGGLLLGGVLAIPVYFMVRVLINQYRIRLRDRISELPLVKVVLKAPIVVSISQWWKRISNVV